MNIGILSYDFDPPIGGLGVVAKMYRDALLSLDSSIVCTVFSPSSASVKSSFSSFVAHRWNKPGGSPLFSLSVFLYLNRFVRINALHVLHVHAGSGGVFVLRRPPCPVVVTAHHTYVQEADLLFRSRPLKRLWKYALSNLEKRTYDIADKIICVSKDTADVLVRRYKVREDKIFVIENPVDRLFLHQARMKRRPRSILYIGRIEERKGVNVLLDAFSSIASLFPDARLTLIGRNLIGDKLMRLLLDRQIQDRVKVTGFQSQGDRIQNMLQADMIVVPSLVEGFGLVAAEAMSLGTPVIVSDCDGLRSIVRDFDTGLIFHSGSSASLQEKILYSLRNTEHVLALAEKASREAQLRFDVDLRSQELFHVLVAASRSPNK